MARRPLHNKETPFVFQSSDTPIVSLDKVEALRQSISDLFIVSDTTLDKPMPGHVRFRGRFTADPVDIFDELRRRFEQFGFTPIIREEEKRIALIGLPTVFNPPASNWVINLVLFIATILSTLYVGALNAIGGADLTFQELLASLWRGWPFCLSIMAILTAHELGHYFAARYHKIAVTLPYFIPLPFQFSLIGTLGAFIRLKQPATNRRVLLDIGAAGPLAGLVFALPILFIGLATSELTTVAPPYLLEGNSILYLAAKYIVFGQILPAGDLDVSLNQVAWAGWVGLLVTALNLIPAGQLDGGHIAYVLFGRRARKFFWPIIFSLFLLVVFTQTFTWAIWIVLLYFVGRVHAEPLDAVTPLDGRRRWIAVFTLILFILIFTPIPLRVVLP